MAEVTFITGNTGVLTTTISDIEAKVQNVTDQTDEKLKKLTDKIDADFKVFDLETDVKICEAIQDYDDILKPIAVVVGAHPKKQHKNKFIQWLLIRLFGYELEYKTIKARTVDICQCCFEEPPVEGKCVCQSCLDWVKYEQQNVKEFDLYEGELI